MKEAAISIIFYEQKVLLIKRRDVPVWVLPGGGIEQNETPEYTAVREAKEETGVDVEVVKKVGTWLPINRLSSPAHVFICDPKQYKEPLLPQEESLEVKFFPLDKLPKTLFFLHQSWIETSLKNLPDRIYMMNELTYWRAITTILSHPILSIRYILSRLGLPLNDR